jgi:hypothetical protein
MVAKDWVLGFYSDWDDDVTFLTLPHTTFHWSRRLPNPNPPDHPNDCKNPISQSFTVFTNEPWRYNWQRVSKRRRRQPIKATHHGKTLKARNIMYPFYEAPCRIYRRCGCSGGEKPLLLMSGIEPRLHCFAAHSLFSVLTELCQSVHF